MIARCAFLKTLLLILFLLIILFIYYRPLQTILPPDANPKKSAFSLYTYGDLDKQLCKKTINSNRKYLFEFSNGLKCPENEEFVTIASIGRTGNIMWAYASVLAVAQQTGLKPYISSCLKSNLDTLFQNLTIPTFKDIINCPVKSDAFAKSIDDWKINPQFYKSIILPRYITLPKEIIPWIPNIWQEFTLKQNLKDSAQQTLKNIIKNLPSKNYTFVGVHVRRTDYKEYLKRKYHLDLVGSQFFLNAMAYFKKKYLNVLFIVVSDDLKWCMEQFAKLHNVFVISDSQKKKNGAALDLAVMVACNHTIYDYGTFGTWGAILAGGEAVFYDMIQNSKEGSMKYNKSWHLMS